MYEYVNNKLAQYPDIHKKIEDELLEMRSVFIWIEMNSKKILKFTTWFKSQIFLVFVCVDTTKRTWLEMFLQFNCRDQSLVFVFVFVLERSSRFFCDVVFVTFLFLHSICHLFIHKLGSSVHSQLMITLVKWIVLRFDWSCELLQFGVIWNSNSFTLLFHHTMTWPSVPDLIITINNQKLSRSHHSIVTKSHFHTNLYKCMKQTKQTTGKKGESCSWFVLSRPHNVTFRDTLSVSFSFVTTSAGPTSNSCSNPYFSHLVICSHDLEKSGTWPTRPYLGCDCSI